jgi:dienelactone hydrolase
MRQVFLALAILLPRPLMSQASPLAPSPAQQLEPGKILPTVQCVAHPEQSYALYLPSKYSRDRRWAIVISSDPAARGTVPLELQKNAAEQLGYVLAASNNSRNGPWKPRLEATDELLNDVRARLSIDTRRVYFAGFSGGARVSSQIALLCKCAAGVLLSGAGFSRGQSPRADTSFPVFSAIGTLDFNYSEMIPLQDSLRKAGYPYWLRIFEGTHQWPPSEVMEEALAWFRIQAMKTLREPRDQSFIEFQFSKALARASAFVQSGDLLDAWREYLQIAATYDTLVDVSSIHEKAETIGKEKAVRDAAKRERNQFEEQVRLSDDITTHLASLPEHDENQLESDRELQEQISRLRRNADQEKHPEKAVVYKRALAGVFVGAMESGNAFLDEKKFDLAIRAYDVASQARPDSEWAWEQLAIARALAGQRKEAISALRRARDLAADKTAFEEWLKREHGFDRLRPSPEFQSLLRRN